ncbi:MAG: hypothetical protein CHACPFDD_04140 [Phycisphaerae bacterium]|nr:hypothetical protein [Phycisphaerae bacterium]
MARRRGPGLRVLLGGLLALGVLARVVRYALNFPLWGDEGFVSVNFLVRDFRGMVEPLIYGQILPLLFMWAELLVVRTLGLSEYAQRLIPLLAGVVTLPLFWRFAARIVAPRAALLATGFLAAAYYPIRHACEVKPYSTDLLIALLLLMLAHDVWRQPRRWPRWVALISLSGAAIWASYPSVFVIGGIGGLLATLWWRQRRVPIALGCAAYFVLTAASFAAMYLVYARPHAEAAARVAEIDMWTETFPPLAEPWKLPLWLLLSLSGNMLAYPAGGRNGASAATFLLVCVGAVRLWRRGRTGDRALLWLLLGPLVFNLVAAAMHRYPFGGTVRTSIFMAPAFCLLAGEGLLAVLRRFVPPVRRRGAIQVAAGVLAGLALVSIGLDVVRPYKKRANCELRRVVRELARQVAANDRVIVYNAIEPRTYAPYIAAWKGDGALLVFYLRTLLPVEPEFAPAQEDVRLTAAGQTWLLAYGGAEFERFNPVEQYRRYCAELESRLGPAEVARHVLQRRRDREGREMEYQTVELRRFGR